MPGSEARTVSESTAWHPISVTEASIFVTRSKAIVRIQMFAEDLILFQGLEANDQDRISPEDLKRGLADHRAFLLERVTLRDAEGEPIKGEVTDVKPFEIPADGILSSDMMLHTATYELEFPFSEPPEFLTIQQDMSDENFIIPSEMKLTVHQSGTALNYTESLLPGASTTVRFDWEQAITEDATDAEWETWFSKQREATLGITSYSSVYSFVYIEPNEIRHEILIPLATLKTILPVKSRDASFIEIDEQDPIRTLIRDWLREENPVTINGARVMPEFSRIDFYGLDLRDFAAQAAEQKVSLASGRVGIILRYQTPDDAVRDATLTWEKYYSTMNKIQSVVISYPDRIDRFEFSKHNKAIDNVLKWTCHPEALPQPIKSVPATIAPRPELTIPVGSLICLAIAFFSLRIPRPSGRLLVSGAALILALAAWRTAGFVIDHPWQKPPEQSDEQATEIFQKLHQGVYRSLDFGSEDRVYDVLATSVDGNLLEKLYLQLHQSLEMREQSGAVARIQSIKYDSGKQIPRRSTTVPWPGFEYSSTWTVAGTVEHWGHIHERQNRFDAVFTIEPRDGNWKITRMDIANQQQVAAKTRLR
ncbi:MAG: hypothetical protein H7Z17_06020 [Fuerstia sp.]|nr:hypothetical protein [Fuerstiella sp.]